MGYSSPKVMSNLGSTVQALIAFIAAALALGLYKLLFKRSEK